MALLELSGVAKSYPGTRALAGVDLTVSGGEVHAVLGQNGAGKSTLMKVIAGSVTPDRGTMTVDGAAVAFGSPEAARAAGIAMVYQELSLVGSLTVGENVLLGRQPTTRWGTVDWAALHREAARHLERIGLDVDPRRGVAGMGTAERQLVEIAKALSTDVRMLVLDEPTSALSDPEARRLFNVVGDLTAAGVAVLYVSHRLAEVLEISDRVTVLRDGARVGTFAVAEVDEDRLARMLVGTPASPEPGPRTEPQPEPEAESERETQTGTEAETETAAGTETATEPSTETASATAATAGDDATVGTSTVLLRVRGLTRPPRLKPIDLELRAGEVVGVFGLVGSGRTRLVNALFGLEPATGGAVEVDGRPVGRPVSSPADAIGLGIGYVGEDRAATLVPRLTVAANITLASMGKLGRGGLLDLAAERQLGQRYVDELAIKATAERPVGTLSGGNQQKVVLARWLCSGARVLLLDDATRGIDVGAKEEVFRLVRRFARDGGAVLYMTSEIREARAVADRVLVMADGRIATAVDPDTPEAEIMAAAGGVHG